MHAVPARPLDCPGANRPRGAQAKLEYILLLAILVILAVVLVTRYGRGLLTRYQTATRSLDRGTGQVVPEVSPIPEGPGTADTPDVSRRPPAANAPAGSSTTSPGLHRSPSGGNPLNPEGTPFGSTYPGGEPLGAAGGGDLDEKLRQGRELTDRELDEVVRRTLARLRKPPSRVVPGGRGRTTPLREGRRTSAVTGARHSPNGSIELLNVPRFRQTRYYRPEDANQRDSRGRWKNDLRGMTSQEVESRFGYHDWAMNAYPDARRHFRDRAARIREQRRLKQEYERIRRVLKQSPSLRKLRSQAAREQRQARRSRARESRLVRQLSKLDRSLRRYPHGKTLKKWQPIRPARQSAQKSRVESRLRKARRDRAGLEKKIEATKRRLEQVRGLEKQLRSLKTAVKKAGIHAGRLRAIDRSGKRWVRFHRPTRLRIARIDARLKSLGRDYKRVLRVSRRRRNWRLQRQLSDEIQRLKRARKQAAKSPFDRFVGTRLPPLLFTPGGAACYRTSRAMGREYVRRSFGEAAARQYDRGFQNGYHTGWANLAREAPPPGKRVRGKIRTEPIQVNYPPGALDEQFRYILGQLRQHRPVVVGVTHMWGQKPYNGEDASDHYVLVTGYRKEKGKEYLTFSDTSGQSDRKRLRFEIRRGRDGKVVAVQRIFPKAKWRWKTDRKVGQYGWWYEQVGYPKSYWLSMVKHNSRLPRSGR